MYGNDLFHGWGSMFSGPIIVIVLVFILLLIWAGGASGRHVGTKM